MAQREATWWDYVKAAFSFRFPIPWLGGVPLNQALLVVAALFAGLFVIAGNLAAAAGVLMLGAAFELYYLYLMCSLPSFRSLVRAELLSQATATTARPETALGELSQAARGRYAQMAGVCQTIETLLTRRQEETDTPWAEALKTGGLNDMRTLYARLLVHEEHLRTYLNTRSVADLPRQVRELEAELNSQRLSAPVRRSKEQTLEVLRQRADQIQQMAQSCELARAELERLDQHLALLRDQAAAGGEVTALVAQIDGAVAGVGETTSWLLDSERLLGETTTEVSVDA